MPYGPVREVSKDKKLSDLEREQKIKEFQQEQEERLRRALGDNLYDWLQDFDDDLDVLTTD